MRALTDELWSGSYTYKDIEEVLNEQLAVHNITDEEWEEYINGRRPVEQSLLVVGPEGISPKDLADYHGISQDDLLSMLRIIGAVKSDDGRFRIPGLVKREPGSRGGWVISDDRSPLRRAGAAGLTLEEVALSLGCSARDAADRLKVEGAVEGEDGRFRLPIRRLR